LTGLSALAMLLMMMTTGNALYTALSYIVLGGFITLLIAHHDGRHVALDDIFEIDARWIYFVFASILKGLIIFAGLMLLVIPGIYVFLRLYFVELLVLDRGMRPMEALRASSEMTKGHEWKLFLFTIVAILIILIGVALLIVGMFPAVIIVMTAIIHMYRELSVEPVTTPETVEK
tara:strand:+ start:19902 stop:20426 length:525 start_codon:yes stop_codon:yes gene_type:complete